MEYRMLAALIIRLAGLLLIVSTVNSAAKSFSYFIHAGSAEKVGIGLLLLSVFVSAILPVVIGALLIYFPKAVTTNVLKIQGLESGTENDLRPLQRVAFAVVGLWLVVYAILDAVYVYAKTRVYFRILEEMPSYSKLPPISPDDFGSIVSAVLQLVIGLWLLIGNRSIVNVLARLRG